MSSVLCVAGRGGVSIAQGVAASSWYLGDAQGQEGAGSSGARVILRSPGTFSNLACICIANNLSGAATVSSYKNGLAGNETFSISGTTGEFADIVNTDSVSAGDTYGSVVATAAGSGAITIATIATTFSATTDTVKKITAAGFTPGGTTGNNFTAITGTTSPNITPESLAQATCRINGTVKNFSTNVASNNIPASSTFRPRYNGANGNIVVSIPANTSGAVEDLANSDSISSGVLLNNNFVCGSSVGGIAIGGAWGFDLVTTDSTFLLANTATATTPGTVAAATANYWPVGGQAKNSKTATEANTTLTSRLAFAASNLGCNITANSITADSTCDLRVNGVSSVMTISLKAQMSGIFEDNNDTVEVLATDKINYRILGGSTGASLSVNGIWMVGTSQGIAFNSVWARQSSLVID